MQLNGMMTSRWISLRRVLTNAWHNLMRNKILAIATTLIIALMFFVFNLVLALSYATDSVIQQVGEKLDISVEIQPDAENYTIQTFVENLKGHPDIKEVVFISKEEALQRFGSKYPHVISFLDNHQLKNPLPNVVRIVSRDISRNNAIIESLEQPKYVSIINQEKLRQDLEQKSRNAKILDITQFIKRVGIWLNVIFAFVAILIIFNSININIHTHKHEIHIMKLVGAKHSFIRGGFIFEGIFYALLALLISVGVSRLVLAYLAKNLISIISNESLLTGLNAILLHFEDRFWLTLSWQALAAILAGIVSSTLAIELYLRKQYSS